MSADKKACDDHAKHKANCHNCGIITAQAARVAFNMRRAEEAEAQLASAERERVVAAAIFYHGVIFSAPPPARHHTVAHAMAEMGLGVEAQRCQGFVTNTGRFVEREAACAIARAAEQIKVKTGPDYILFSEDVW